MMDFLGNVYRSFRSLDPNLEYPGCLYIVLALIFIISVVTRKMYICIFKVDPFYNNKLQ